MYENVSSGDGVAQGKTGGRMFNFEITGWETSPTASNTKSSIGSTERKGPYSVYYSVTTPSTPKIARMQ